MSDHGTVAVGAKLEQAVEHALLLEWLAALHHRASVLGTPRVLTEEQQAGVCGLSRDRDLRGAAQLGCATATQVAQGLGTDAGTYSLESVQRFAADTPTLGG